MKKKSKSPTTIEKPSLNLSKTLEAFDRRDYSYYEKLPDDFKKQFAPFVLMRFMSCSATQASHEYFLQVVNFFVNRDFWTLSKYPDFQHLLLCLCGTGTKHYHKWIANKQKKKEAWVDLYKEKYPSINLDEIEILKKNLTPDDIFQLSIDLGKSNVEAKEFVKSFKNEKK